MLDQSDTSEGLETGLNTGTCMNCIRKFCAILWNAFCCVCCCCNCCCNCFCCKCCCFYDCCRKFIVNSKIGRFRFWRKADSEGNRRLTNPCSDEYDREAHLPFVAGQRQKTSDDEYSENSSTNEYATGTSYQPYGNTSNLQNRYKDVLIDIPVDYSSQSNSQNSYSFPQSVVQNSAPTEDKLELDSNLWRYIEAYRMNDVKTIIGPHVKLVYHTSTQVLHLQSSVGWPIKNKSDKVISLVKAVDREISWKSNPVPSNVDVELFQQKAKAFAVQLKCVFYIKMPSANIYTVIGPHETWPQLDHRIRVMAIELAKAAPVQHQSSANVSVASTLEKPYAKMYLSSQVKAEWDQRDTSNRVPYVSDHLQLKTNCGICVRILRNNLLSESVDAIVCSVDTGLSLSGGASAAVSGAVGPELKKACQDYIKKHGRLNVTEVMHCSAGKLSHCIKYVMLAAGPRVGDYTDGRQVFEAVRDTFLNCLQYANDTLQVSSISIPAISSGMFGVPKQVVAEAAYDALMNFDRLSCQGYKQRVTNVRFVNIDPETTQVFVSVFDKLHPRGSIVPQKYAGNGPIIGDLPVCIPSSTSHSLITSSDGDKLSFVSSCGITVSVYCDDLLSETVDAVVCSVNGQLKLGGGAARAIVKAAGDEVEKESTNVYFRRGSNFPFGSVVHVTAGKLRPKIKYVILVVGPHPDKYGGPNSFFAALVETFYNCLQYANKELKISSLAIPAISSGYIGASTQTVAQAAYDALLKFDGVILHGEVRRLQSVHFVNIDRNTSQAFVDAFKGRRCGGQSTTSAADRTAGTAKINDKLPVGMQEFVEKKRVRMLKTSTNQMSLSAVQQAIVQCKIAESLEFSGLCIGVSSGNLVDEKVDAIVCPMNFYLKPDGSIGKAVADAGGREMEEACIEVLRDRDRLAVTEVTEVPASGTLRRWIKAVILAVVPSQEEYTKDREMLLKNLTETLYNCLQYANDRMNISSISFPVVWSFAGKTVDENDVAEATCEALRMFNESFRVIKTRHVEKINFVHNEQSIAASFHQKLVASISRVVHPSSHAGCGVDYVDSPSSSASKPSRQLKKTSDTDGQTADDNLTYSVNESARADLSGGNVPLKKPKSMDAGDVSNEPQPSVSETKDDEEGEEDCVICMCEVTDPKTLACGHKFCTDCIAEYFTKCQPKCPSCGKLFGVMRGNQPAGTMNVEVIRQSVAGYESYDTIKIEYDIPDGIQTDEHPNPGVQYYGTRRTCLLPNNDEGKEVLKLLKQAFDARLIFTVGRSITTGADNMVIWNDIHHKTAFSGPYGYPDPSYLSRVKIELATKGISADSSGGQI